MMLTNEEFRKQAHQLVDWMADYMGKVDRFPVKSQVAPGVIKNQIPSQAPVKSNGMDEIFDDFKKIILPGSKKSFCRALPIGKALNFMLIFRPTAAILPFWVRCLWQCLAFRA